MQRPFFLPAHRSLRPRAADLRNISVWRAVCQPRPTKNKQSRGRFSHRKKHTAPGGPGPGRPRAEAGPSALTRRRENTDALAQRLWSPSYDDELLDEAHNEAALFGSVVAAVEARQSTYATQGRRSLEAQQKYAALVGRAARGISSQVVRLGNQSLIPFSIAARSLSWLMQMVKSKAWKQVLGRRRPIHHTRKRPCRGHGRVGMGQAAVRVPCLACTCTPGGPSEARAIRLLAVEIPALLEDHGARVADHDQLRAELGHLALAHALEVGRDVDPLAFAQLPCVATVGRLPGGHGS